MTNEQFKKMLTEFIEEETKLLESKGTEYTRDSEDRLDNFKRLAKYIPKGDPKMVWIVYFMKHVDAILNYIYKGKEYSGESIFERIHDARNYLFLLAALIKDEF